VIRLPDLTLTRAYCNKFSQWLILIWVDLDINKYLYLGNFDIKLLPYPFIIDQIVINKAELV